MFVSILPHSVLRATLYKLGYNHYNSLPNSHYTKDNIIIPYNFLSGMPDKSRETQIMPSLELKLDSNGKYL